MRGNESRWVTADGIRRVAVLGAGLMGSGIAQVFAQAGYEVRLWARRAEGLDAALARIRANQRTMRDLGALNEARAADTLARIASTTDLRAALAGADFVSENIAEDLPAKHALFDQVNSLAPPETILTTNTSGFAISAVGEGVEDPARLAGFHWLNPPHLTSIVEVIPGARTAPAVIDATVEITRRIGKQPVRLKRDWAGFIINRIQFAVMREAYHLVESGVADPEAVDLVVSQGLGLRWAAVGPFRLMDLAGLPTFERVAAALFPQLSQATEAPPFVQDLIARGHLGARSGRGLYDYPPGAAEAEVAKRDRRLITMRAALDRIENDPGKA